MRSKAKRNTRQMDILPYGRQSLGRAEYRAVLRTLKSRFLTQGPAVEHFEAAIREVTGAPYAVAVANGTAALQLAVQAIKIQYCIQDGALGLTSPNTFVASGNAMLYNRLKPLFCDIAGYNMSLDGTEALLAQHNNTAQAQKPVALLLPVHFAGQTLDMRRLWQLACRYGKDGTEVTRLPIVEDAAHALGSRYEEAEENYKKKHLSLPAAVGSCRYSDACCFSFHPVKTITSGEGGAITCKDPSLYRLLLQLRSHGITRSADLWQNAEQHGKTAEAPLWYYEMQHLGHNARLSDIHAALGTAQLERLKYFVHKRRKQFLRYNQALQGLPWLRTPKLDRYCCPHLYVVQIDFEQLGINRNVIMQRLRNKRIGSQVHYIPMPMQPYYRGLGYTMNGLEQCAAYYCKALSLPLYPALSRHQQQCVIRAVVALGEA